MRPSEYQDSTTPPSLARHYTGADWISKREMMLGDWPLSKKQRTVARGKSGQTNKAYALLRRLGL